MTGRRPSALALLLVLAALVGGGGVLRPAGAGAADVRVHAGLDRESAAIGEEVTLTITVEGARGGSAPNLPELLAFTVFSAGTSQNISIVNGSFASSQTFTYVLVPLRSGTQTIPPIEIERGGTMYRTSPLSLVVTAGGAAPPGGGGAQGLAPSPGAPPATPAPRGARGSGAPVTGRAGDPMFLTASLSKDRAYVNEEVILTIRFYRRVDPVDTPEYTPPALTGFWVEDLPPQRTYYDTVNGVQYMVTELKNALFPTGPGRLTVGSAALRCQIRERDDRAPSSGDPFDAFQRGFFGDLFGRIRPVAVKSEPVGIDVMPLPEAGKPPAFSGAVGHFSIRAVLSPPQVPAGEPATLRITMSGRGNVKSLPDVTLPPIPGVRVYDGKGSLQLSKENYEVGGAKVVEKVLVPGTTGHYVIPTIEVPVYEPGKGYVTLRAEPLTLVATASRPGVAGGPAPGGAPEEIAAGERDIRHIRTEAGEFALRASGSPAGPAFFALQVVPLLAVGAALGLRYERRRRERNPALVRSQRAGREARRRLAEARARAAAGNRAETSAAVARGLTGFLADRLNLDVASLTPREAGDELRARGVEEPVVRGVETCLEHCDLARFAPSAAGVPSPSDLLNEAHAVIGSLEGVNLARRPVAEPARSR